MIRNGPRSIIDGEFTLREVTLEDSPLLHQWRMEPSTRLMFKRTDFVPFDDHHRFFQRYFLDDNDDRWFILEHSGVPVAALALYDFNADGECEWGRHLVPLAQRGHGYGVKVFEMMLRYAREAGVKRIRAEVLADNDAALRCYPRFGFTEQRQYVENGRVYRQLALDLE